jgi:hypothetical protein
MGQVLIHVGMAKAGSTTLQRALAERLDSLAHRGVQVLTTRVDGEGPNRQVSLQPATPGDAHANKLLMHYRLSDRAPAVLERFASELAGFADAFPTVVLTSETFEPLCVEPDLSFLRVLSGVAEAHRVCLVYYVRPQPSAFESHWRHFGFREEMEPSAYFAHCARKLDYHRTVEAIRAAAPRLEVVVRPFRNDLLAGGNIASDFLRILDVADDVQPDDDAWENRGLPLELANALRFAPNGLFWERRTHIFTRRNDAFDRLKQLFAGVELPVDAPIARSRLVLQAHCHSRFECGNRELIATFGWPIDTFVPPVEVPPGDVGGIEELDELWRPRADATELAGLFHALKAAISESGPKQGK